MKHGRHSQSHNQHRNSASASDSTSAANPSEIDFTPSADDVAKRAYSTNVNQGRVPGHDMEHWLAAEGQLLAEHKLS